MSTDSTQGYSNNITSNSFAFALEPDSCAYPHDFGIDLCGVWQLGCYATEGNMDVDETYSFTGEAAISPDDEVGGCCHAVRAYCLRCFASGGIHETCALHLTPCRLPSSRAPANSTTFTPRTSPALTAARRTFCCRLLSLAFGPTWGTTPSAL